MPPEMESKLETMFFGNCRRKHGNEELFQLLVYVVHLSVTAYLITDGIDECKDEGRCQLLPYLNKLIRVERRLGCCESASECQRGAIAIWSDSLANSRKLESTPQI